MLTMPHNNNQTHSTKITKNVCPPPKVHYQYRILVFINANRNCKESNQFGQLSLKLTKNYFKLLNYNKLKKFSQLSKTENDDKVQSRIYQSTHGKSTSAVLYRNVAGKNKKTVATDVLFFTDLQHSINIYHYYKMHYQHIKPQLAATQQVNLDYCCFSIWLECHLLDLKLAS